MTQNSERSAMLSPYRVLDLTDEQATLCGKLFADLGAEVIKLEPPGGDRDRLKGPFYRDERDPEKSLHWFAYNTGKKSVTLDLESEAGRDLFRRLVITADFLIESTPADHLENLGLGYDELHELNPLLGSSHRGRHAYSSGIFSTRQGYIQGSRRYDRCG